MKNNDERNTEPEAQEQESSVLLPDIQIAVAQSTGADKRMNEKLIRAALANGAARVRVAFRLYQPGGNGQARGYKDIKGTGITVRCLTADAVARVQEKVTKALAELARE